MIIRVTIIFLTIFQALCGKFDSEELDVIEEAFKYQEFDTIYKKWCPLPPNGRHCINSITDPVIDINVEAGFPENDWLITREYKYPGTNDFYYLLKHDFMIEGVTAYNDKEAKNIFKRIRDERYRALDNLPDPDRPYLEFVDCCLQINEFKQYPKARRFILLYKRVQGSSARSWIRHEEFSKYTNSPASKFALSMNLIQQVIGLHKKNIVHGHIHYDAISMNNGCFPALHTWNKKVKAPPETYDPDEVVVGEPDWEDHPYYLGSQPIDYLDNYDMGLMIFEFSAPRFTETPYNWGTNWRGWCRERFIWGDPNDSEFDLFIFCRFFYPIILKLTEDGNPVKPISAAKALALLQYELLRFIAYSPEIYYNFWNWIEEGMCGENKWFVGIVDQIYRKIDEIAHYIRDEKLGSLRRKEYKKLRPEFFEESGYWQKAYQKEANEWADWLVTVDYAGEQKSEVVKREPRQILPHQLI